MSHRGGKFSRWNGNLAQSFLLSLFALYLSRKFKIFSSVESSFESPSFPISSPLILNDRLLQDLWLEISFQDCSSDLLSSILSSCCLLSNFYKSIVGLRGETIEERQMKRCSLYPLSKTVPSTLPKIFDVNKIISNQSKLINLLLLLRSDAPHP